MKFSKKVGGGLLIVILVTSCFSEKKEAASLNLDKILESNVLKTKETLKTLVSADSFPRNVEKGSRNWKLVGVKDWCSGFWPGVLWYAYEASGDEYIKKEAEKFTLPIKQIAYSSASDHDIGFQVYCSFGNGYRLTGNTEYKEVMLAAADTLATLYNPIVGSIHSWPMKPQYPHNTIIDNMMNLELLFWAAKNGGSKRLYDIAESHAEVTMKNLVRPDYSTYHLGAFDNKTGAFLRGVAHQGYADNSMWARGQTWGIYGLAFSYRETGRDDFLDTSIKLADKFLERLPQDGIPFWDFDDPKIPNAPKDASAAAIAACGMLELANFVKEDALKNKYYNAAKGFIDLLSTDKYLSGNKNQGLLLHSTGHHPKNSEIDEPIIYADYYYMEALLRLKNWKS
ncbi:glucuronyl hydrolase [Algibacter amylolyticus]|uniref:Glucuronyl hydrolase n=1 Tax=Algibacter amylolyticus TaxID=1608400 RepID=A0A5M7B7C2_9FLAO|nr:glycoside hydrolase family 88 protein [Algibacter amylolyticus]KAA5825189.1 glucuronyl hydrolase [Algibacter amylolyticus]MBB5268693.1 unsaturated chondroitin disaccharide hydrolase [Algibacter amylolyticus]TSJ77683.1 glucuronyl hydrolase [Algibacter amylolyticus]